MKSFVKVAALLAVSALFSVLAHSAANADHVTFQFGGVIASVTNDPSSPLPAPWNGLSAGQSWSMTYVFESTTPNSSLDGNYGQYMPLVSYSLTAGGNTENGLANTGIIQVFGNPASGSVGYMMTGFLGSLPGGSFGISLSDPTLTAFNSNALPLTLHLTKLPDRNFFLFTALSDGGTQSAISGTVDTFQVIGGTTNTPPITITVKRVHRECGDRVEVIVRVTNTGKETAKGVQLLSANLGGKDTTTHVPTIKRHLVAGEHHRYELNFKHVRPGSYVPLLIKGTSSLGEFELNQTVTVP